MANRLDTLHDVVDQVMDKHTHGPKAPALVQREVCGFCGCTEDSPSRLSTGEPCSWLNYEHTICNSPQCAALALRTLPNKRDAQLIDTLLKMDPPARKPVLVRNGRVGPVSGPLRRCAGQCDNFTAGDAYCAQCTRAREAAEIDPHNLWPTARRACMVPIAFHHSHFFEMALWVLVGAAACGAFCLFFSK